jgi:hypothetical protein
VSTPDLKGDRLAGKGDRLPNRVIEHPIETRRQSRIETRDTGVHKFKSPGPMRASRQTGFVPGRMSGSRMGGGGFGSHFAMGGGGHGGFGRR